MSPAPGGSVEIEDVLKFFLQGDAQHQRQLGRGVELAGFDGADGVAGDAHHLGQVGLGEFLFRPDLFQAVS